MDKRVVVEGIGVVSIWVESEVVDSVGNEVELEHIGVVSIWVKSEIVDSVGNGVAIEDIGEVSIWVKSEVVVHSVVKIAVDEVLANSEDTDVVTSKVASEFEEVAMASKVELDSSTVTEAVSNVLDVSEEKSGMVVVISKVDVTDSSVIVVKSTVVEVDSIVVKSVVEVAI